MIKNSTVNDNSTSIVELYLNNDDTNGAVIYIIIILLWYSIGIVFVLGMQMLARSEEIEDFARHRTRFLMRNLRNNSNTKEILEELADKQNRDRLWDIYLGTTWDAKAHLTRAETVRIRHIEKQLATIERNRRLTHDAISPSKNDIRYIRSCSEHRRDASQLLSEAISTLRRRSSFDQQIFDRWKEQLKFRRHRKKSSTSRPEHSYTTIPTINNEQTDLISLTDLSTITPTINERQNSQ